MIRPLYMTSKELLDNFGKGPKGHRVISSDTVQFLLANPSPTRLEILIRTGIKAIFETRADVPPNTIYLLNPDNIVHQPSLFNIEVPNIVPTIDIKVNWDDLSSD